MAIFLFSNTKLKSYLCNVGLSDSSSLTVYIRLTRINCLIFLAFASLFLRTKALNPMYNQLNDIDMEKKISICDYLTDASAYINDLNTLSQEREWPSEPTKEFLTSEFWEAYVDQIVEDGLKVGQDGYILSYLEDYEEGLCG